MDHEMKPEWLANIELVCGKQDENLNPRVNLTPAEQTYGKVVYAMAYFGALIGCIFENKCFNNKRND